MTKDKGVNLLKLGFGKKYQGHFLNQLLILLKATPRRRCQTSQKYR